MIRAVIFDLDGVILDSEPIHFEAHQKAFKEFGIDLTLEDYMDFGVAMGDENLFQKASEKYGVALDGQGISSYKRKICVEILKERAKPRAGIVELIRNLYPRFVLAIASSGSDEVVKFIVKKFSLGNYFRAIVTARNIEKVKPHPDAYLKAIEKLGEEKKNCIAIEDSYAGLESAKNAGMKCIAIPCEFTKNQDFSQADIVLDGPENITEDLINKL